jgi:hypothetical protein
MNKTIHYASCNTTNSRTNSPIWRTFKSRVNSQQRNPQIKVKHKEPKNSKAKKSLRKNRSNLRMKNNFKNRKLAHGTTKPLNLA